MPPLGLDDRHIAILGFGAEGQAALALLTEAASPRRITVLEENPRALAPHRERLRDRGIDTRTGADALYRLEQYDLVIKSPGISPYRSEIRTALERGARFTSGTQLWCDAHPNERLIVVTGTKGKSTTASLLAHLLNAAGHRCELIGNIGRPALEAFDPSPPPEFWVMELSSYQATGLRCQAEIALLLNLFPEHTDWHGSTERYYRDKTDFMLAPDIRQVIVEAAKTHLPARLATARPLLTYNGPDGFHLAGDAIFRGPEKQLDADAVPIPGAHNRLNLCAALTVIETLGLDVERVLPHLASFRGLPHRLHSLGERDGIEFIDDSISTTPQSALAALLSAAPRPCTQLLGGYDRGLDWSDYAKGAAASSLHCAVVLPDNGERIAAALRKEMPGLKIVAARDMPDAVSQARAATPVGGVVLLSPGAPSYGHYRDFRDRGRQFAVNAGFVID